ncbi:MAG: hypothetical protein KA293_06935, partial [Bacteroidia bacterium]|nr:hypothetical protein [Bacteroidia bacterium]
MGMDATADVDRFLPDFLGAAAQPCFQIHAFGFMISGQISYFAANHVVIERHGIRESFFKIYFTRWLPFGFVGVGARGLPKEGRQQGWGRQPDFGWYWPNSLAF